MSVKVTKSQVSDEIYCFHSQSFAGGNMILDILTGLTNSLRFLCMLLNILYSLSANYKTYFSFVDGCTLESCFFCDSF